MNWFDIIIAILLLGGLISGFRNGVIGELANLAGLILGVWGAIRFSWWTAGVLADLGIHSQYMHIISFIITFILIVIVVQILSKFLTKLAETLFLGFVNRIAGMAVGLIKTALILSVLIYAIGILDENSSFIKEEVREESLFYEPLSELVPTILPFLHMEDLQKEENPTRLS